MSAHLQMQLLASHQLHDYHLYLAPLLIRQRHPEVVMEQFIHIPWPDVHCRQFLPGTIVRDIYRGLVGNDLLSFQTERDARNFLEGARTLLEEAEVDFEEDMVAWQWRLTRARAYPISVSVEGERRLVQSAAGRRAAEQLLQDFTNVCEACEKKRKTPPHLEGLRKGEDV
jgi:trehalose 6-phosphate synthase